MAIGLGIKMTNWWHRSANGPPFGGDATLTDSLLSYWKMDESAAGNRTDVVNQYVMVDINSNVGSGVGKNNKASSWGTTSRLSAAYSAALYPGQNGTGFAINAWVRRNANPSSNFFRFIAEGNTTPAFGMTVNSAGKFLAFARVGANILLSALAGATTVTNDSWHMLTMVHDVTAGKVRTYADNSLQNTSSSTNSGNLVNNALGYHIGYEPQIPNYFNSDNASVCLIDEVGVWDRWLTDGEIASLHNSGDGLFY